MKKKQHGGDRPGAGRKGKYGEKTKKIFFWVPISKAPFIKQIVNAELEKLKIVK